MNHKSLYTAVLLAATLNATAQQITEPTDTLHEVVVTGTNNATSSNHLPYSISTVSHSEIEATGRTQLLSALTGRIPSLFVTERNILGFGVSTGGSGGIKLRGVGGSPTNQLLMMVDGKPQYASVFSHHIADNYESEYVDHVEIVRGPSSVLYGSNAMGGAINVITKTPQQDGVKTTVQSQYGSYNTWQSAVTNMVRKGKFSSLVSAGFDRTDGTQENFDFKQGSAYAKLGYEFTANWNAYADYSFMKFKGNDPIYAALEKGTDDIYHQDVLRGEASLVISDRYQKTNGAARVYYSHGNNQIEDPKPFQMLDSRLGILAYQNYQPWEYSNLTVGFDFDRYTGEVPLSGGIKRTDSKTPATMDPQDIVEYSPYITLSQGVWKNLIVANAGIRMANSNMFGTHWIPQAGITVNPGCQWTIKANVSKGYRNPSFKELYLYKMANEDLNPEEMMNYEVSLGKAFSRYLNLEATAYLSKGSNLIQSVFDQQKGHQFNVNTGRFTNRGIEFSAISRPINTLNLRATYSVLKSNIHDLTGAPKHQYSIGADWTPMSKLIVNADLVGVSRLFVASDVAMQNYAVLNLKVTYKVLPYLDLFAQGNNLTNARYCINKGYEMPGITATGGFKFRF